MGKAFVAKLARQGARDPQALAAWIGRHKLGKKTFQKIAKQGREEHAAEEQRAADHQQLLQRVRPGGRLVDDLTALSDNELGSILPDIVPEDLARIEAEMDRRDIASRLPGARPDLVGLSDRELGQRTRNASEQELAAIAEEADRRQRIATVFPRGHLARDLSKTDEDTLAWAIPYARPDEVERIAAEIDSRYPPTPLPAARGTGTVAGQLADRAAMDEALGSDPDGWAHLALPDDRQDLSSSERWVADREQEVESARTAYTRKQVRQMYREHVYGQWLEAEDELRGELLNRRAEAAGVDAATLFTGPAHVAFARASEELRRWWQDHPRTTLAEYTEQITGERTAAGRTARQSLVDQLNRL